MSFLVTETPEGLSLRAEIAGPGSRTVASLLDLLLFVIAAYLLLLASFLVPGLGGTLSTWIAFGFGLALMFYQPVCALVMRGATPGKRLNRLIVVDEEGFPATLLQHVIRGLFWPLEMLPFPLPIGVMCIAGSQQGQRLGDRVAGTIVLRLPDKQLPEDPHANVEWTQLSKRRLSLVPAHSARFDDRDLVFLRKLVGRQGVDIRSYGGLLRRSLEHYLKALGMEPPKGVSAKEARAILSELYVFLRHMRTRP